MDFDIFLLYRQFSEIKSGKSYPCREGVNVLIDETEKAKFSRETMAQFSKMMDSTINMRAVAAWKLVLAGRFRLLNQWCDFVEKTQRHNISEDTWCQVLAFSQCIQEDLEGFDSQGSDLFTCFLTYTYFIAESDQPRCRLWFHVAAWYRWITCPFEFFRGAWPTLIDDFVEHMYRITGSSDRNNHNLTCTSGKPEGDLSPSAYHLPGLRSFPGSKRKHHNDSQRSGLEHNSLPRGMINSINWLKRRK